MSVLGVLVQKELISKGNEYVALYRQNERQSTPAYIDLHFHVTVKNGTQNKRACCLRFGADIPPAEVPLRWI